MKAVRKTLLDTAPRLSAEEYRLLLVDEREALKKRLNSKRGGQVMWTPETLASLLEHFERLKSLGLTPGTIHLLLAKIYRCTPARVANLLSEARRTTL